MFVLPSAAAEIPQEPSVEELDAPRVGFLPTHLRVEAGAVGDDPDGAAGVRNVGLGRVVEGPLDPGWPCLAAWRFMGAR